MSPLVLSMCMFALAGAISPGPVNLLAAHMGARTGFIRALPYVLGATLSYVAILWLTGQGLSQVLLACPVLTQYLQYVGAAYLLYLSARIARATPSADGNQPSPPRRGSWLQGVLSQSLNPKAWLVAISGVGLFTTTAGTDATTALLLLLCGISGAVCFVSVSVWVALGQSIGHWLASARNQRRFNLGMAGLLVLTVARMLWPAG